MKCEEFEHEWQELDDPSLFSPAMEAHAQNCSSCAAKVRDVNLIRWQARQMVETEQPPERVWLNIRRRLGQEALVREPGGWPSLGRLLAFEWLPPLPMGLAYAAVFFLALGGVLSLRNLLTPVSTPASLPPTAMVRNAPKAEAPPPARSAERDEAVQQVIEKAPPEFRRAIEKAPPERQAVFVARWEELNRPILRVESARAVLEDYVAANPDDQLVLMQLNEVREQERRLLESFMRSEDWNR